MTRKEKCDLHTITTTVMSLMVEFMIVFQIKREREIAPCEPLSPIKRDKLNKLMNESK